MLAWERQEGESSKAFEAFATYRDLGAQRSLAKVGQILGKSTALMERWSRQHDWVARVEALEARDEMLVRERMEQHLEEQVEDHAKRRANLVEKVLEVAELAADQAVKMAKWPLSEQQALDEDGRTIIIAPAKWSKGTVRQMFDIATFGASGKLPGPDPEEVGGVEFDFSELSEEELAEYIRISDKLGVKRKDSSDGRG